MRPTDCALLVAVPVTREEFGADLARGTDFTRLFRQGREGIRDGALWDFYRPYADLALRVADGAAGLGVRVFYRCTRAAFQRALEESPVVTVVAHWRGAAYRDADILDPAAARARAAPLLSARNGRSCGESVAALLNGLLDAALGQSGPAPGGSAAAAALAVRAQYALWEARRALDAVLGAAVAGGPAVEFADGPASIQEMAGAVAPGFAGTLDLTICNSVLLAEEIRRKCRAGVVLSNAFPASLDVRLALYAQAVKLLARRRLSYMDAITRLRRQMRRMS